jgi:hypothetical protein
MVQAIDGAPKGYKRLYDKARTLGLDKERAKIPGALGNLQMLGTIMGYQLYMMVGQMLKAGH